MKEMRQLARYDRKAHSYSTQRCQLIPLAILEEKNLGSPGVKEEFLFIEPFSVTI